MKRWIMILLIFGFETAFAYGREGLNFAINTFYYTKKDETKVGGGTGSTSESRYLYNDVLAGYIFSNNLYLGILYGSDTINHETGSGASSEVITHYGASAGYKSEDWYFLGHYIFNGSYTLSGGAKWSDLTGLQVDVGYIFSMGSSFGLGPQISYRKLEYKTYEVSGVSSSGSSYIRTEIMPALALNFGF